jgi:DNA (cytosine-5)-methyltransferase 1
MEQPQHHTTKLNGLDLFSGIGGFAIGLKNYVRTVGYCENERYCQAVLLSRMQDKTIDMAPIWDDVTTLHSEHLGEIPIDIIIGGFPCQNISCAGRGEGLAGAKSGLFREIVRLAQEFGAPYLFLENVPAIRTRGLDEVAEELAESGYHTRWLCVSASSLGAPHKRKRWFCLAIRRTSVADAVCEGGLEKRGVSVPPALRCEDVAREASHTRVGTHEKELSEAHERGRTTFWDVEPSVGRVANGIPNKSHRLHALGNAVVPQQALFAFETLWFGQ